MRLVRGGFGHLRSLRCQDIKGLVSAGSECLKCFHSKWRAVGPPRQQRQYEGSV